MHIILVQYICIQYIYKLFLSCDTDTFRETRVINNEDFETDWIQCEAILKKCCVPRTPPSYWASLHMYSMYMYSICTRLPHRGKNTEFGSIELRPDLQKSRNAILFFSWTIGIWDIKKAKVVPYANFEPEKNNWVKMAQNQDFWQEFKTMS